MNIIHKLTLRHLMQNKKQTLVTLIGVMLSVAMVTAVITLGSSYLVLMQKQMIQDYGEWHVLYKNVNKDQLETIKQDEATQQFITSKERGYALLPGSQNINKPYLFIKAFNAQGFKNFPIALSEGRLPQQANEIVLSEAIATNAKVTYRIGDRLALDVGQRSNPAVPGDTDLNQNKSLRFINGTSAETLIHTTTETYTVVGFIKRPSWEQTWAPGYTALTYVDENMLDTNKTVDASVVLKKVDGTVFAHANNLFTKNNISSFETNESLLRYYGVMGGGLGETYSALFVIVVLVIGIGSISLIYNAFAISVSERSRYLGMLSSVGATRSQKRNSVYFEGAVIGVISIPLGVICGLIGIGITFRFINSMLEAAIGVTEKLTLVVTPSSLAMTCLISIVTIFISTYLPAQKASKISAIDAIRQTMDIKLTGKTVKTSKLVQLLFGIEAELGLKNLKRNKRRYYATVFSLVISIVLFLSVSFFTSNLQRSLDLSQKGYNYDIGVYKHGEVATIDRRLMKSIVSLEGVTDYSLIKQWFDVFTWVAEKSIPEGAKPPWAPEQGRYKYNIQVNALSEDKLKAYAKKIGIEYAKLTNPDHPTAILIDVMTYKDKKDKIIEMRGIQGRAGEMLDLFSTNSNEESVSKVELAAVTDQFPMGIIQSSNQVHLVVSEPVIDQLMKKSKDKAYSGLYLSSKDPLKTQQDIEEMKNELSVRNIFQERQRSEQRILLLSVFVYGFVALITAVSMANIFNTISTSIALRKREFAMLRSVGMTPKSFNKMMNYESIFYGIKALTYGLPVSAVIMVLIYRAFMYSFSYGFIVPWTSILYVIVAVFVIVSLSMYYASIKVKKANIIDALKQENL
ncbi:putative ABC transport system permease protein [Paenibacillus tianmuensis]|uniref:Putative ABC transport system permease protein n=1 Tax=Paenibacillus tianmuensis TaxID=624147 RepID=A0A1G4S930_9BACL|nr:ABC transporter permease [Paenibacillus tianmuensis]SCW65713.1 putative ABC transport system permease protein [Paenibacillus tianmuensis]